MRVTLTTDYRLPTTDYWRRSCAPLGRILTVCVTAPVAASASSSILNSTRFERNAIRARLSESDRPRYAWRRRLRLARIVRRVRRVLEDRLRQRGRATVVHVGGRAADAPQVFREELARSVTD